MKITVKRESNTANSTSGTITIDTIAYKVFSLEPPEGGFDETLIADANGTWITPITRHYDRIPAGIYWVEVHESPTLGEVLHICNGDPGFDNREYYFHVGNWCLNGTGAPLDFRTGKKECDTHGCILPGYEHGVDAVFHSGSAFKDLFAIVKPELEAGRKVEVEIC